MSLPLYAFFTVIVGFLVYIWFKFVEKHKEG